MWFILQIDSSLINFAQSIPYLFIFFDRFLLKFDMVECCWCLFDQNCQLIWIIWSRKFNGSNKEVKWLVYINSEETHHISYSYIRTIKRVGLCFSYYNCNYSDDCLLMCCYEYFIWTFDLWPYHIRFKSVNIRCTGVSFILFLFLTVFSCFIQSMLFFRPGSEDILYFAFLFLSKFHVSYIIISHKSNRKKRLVCVFHMFCQKKIYISSLVSTPLKWIKRKQVEEEWLCCRCWIVI